jgi:hypothetical protein
MQFVRRAVKEFIDILWVLAFLLLAELSHKSTPEPLVVLFPTARVPFHLPLV